MHPNWPRITERDIQPEAYVCQGKQPYRITEDNGSTLTLENALTGKTFTPYRSTVLTGYGLARAAPPTEAPDTLPADLCSTIRKDPAHAEPN